MLDVITFAAQKAGEGKKVALVTVTETSGSSPASVGQMIAVLADGSTKRRVFNKFLFFGIILHYVKSHYNEEFHRGA